MDTKNEALCNLTFGTGRFRLIKRSKSANSLGKLAASPPRSKRSKSELKMPAIFRKLSQKVRNAAPVADADVVAAAVIEPPTPDFYHSASPEQRRTGPSMRRLMVHLNTTLANPLHIPPKVFSSVRPVILKSSTTAEANKATNSTVVIANKLVDWVPENYNSIPRKIVKSKSYRALESGRMPEENSLPEIARYATKKFSKNSCRQFCHKARLPDVFTRLCAASKGYRKIL